MKRDARSRSFGLARRLFPPSCVLCGCCVDPGRPPVCGSCWSRLPRASPPRCSRCGAPSPRFLGDLEACGECIGWPRALARVRAPYLMQRGAALLVRALKYHGWTALAGRMGRSVAGSAREVAEAGGAEPGNGATLVPVPLTAARRRRRGFNQAELIARALGRELEWPVGDVLRRHARGRRQARLGREERRMNVRGLFGADGPASREHEADGARTEPTVLVVDDVVTTGSTAAACAGALREAGWRPVGAVAFARAAVGTPVDAADADGRDASERPLRAEETSRDG